MSAAVLARVSAPPQTPPGEDKLASATLDGDDVEDAVGDDAVIERLMFGKLERQSACKGERICYGRFLIISDQS